MPARPYHRGDLRNTLIEEGIRLVNQDGIGSFSLRKLAARCEVSHAAPYAHFQSKEELLEAMFHHVTDQLAAVLEETLRTGPPAGDPETLIRLGKTYVRFFLQNPPYLPFLFSQPCLRIDLALNADPGDNFAPYELFRQTALQVFETLKVPRENLETEIIASWAAVHGLASIATMTTVRYEDWESQIDAILRNGG